LLAAAAKQPDTSPEGVKQVATQEASVNQYACRICSNQINSLSRADDDGKVTYDCPVCGIYILTPDSHKLIEQHPCQARLSSWIREQKELGHEAPVITDVNFFKVLQQPEPSEHQQQTCLLRALEVRSKYPGHAVELELWRDYPYACAANAGEFRNIVRALLGRNLVRLVDKSLTLDAIDDVDTLGLVLTHHGWKYLDNEAVKEGLLEMVVALTTRSNHKS
jgi:hypothetical protein